MVGAPDVVQPWMPRAARDSEAWLCHVSIVGGARRRGCAAGGVPLFFSGPLARQDRHRRVVTGDPADPAPAARARAAEQDVLPRRLPAPRPDLRLVLGERPREIA